jgi:hypothetical protein
METEPHAGDDLFRAAVSHSLRVGKLTSKEEASQQQSRQTAVSFVLVGHNGQIIERIPLGKVQAEARRMAAVAAASEAASAARQKELEGRIQLLRQSPARTRASAWAQSVGYEIPKGPDWGLYLTAIIILGLFFVIPGLIAAIIYWVRKTAYDKEMRSIVEKWIDAGRPDPVIPETSSWQRS